MTYAEAVVALRGLGVDHVVLRRGETYELEAKTDAADRRRREQNGLAILSCGHGMPSPPPQLTAGIAARTGPSSRSANPRPSAPRGSLPCVLPASKVPQRVLLLLAVVLYAAAGMVALGLGDGNYGALIAFGSAAFAGAWAMPGPSP